MCQIDNDEPATLWEEDVVIARKQHVCRCCRGLIRAGQPYTKHFSLFDGDVTSEKKCAACSLMAEEFLAAHGVYFAPSQMPEALQTCIWEEEHEGEEGRVMAAKWKRHLRNMERRAATRKAQEAPP